MIICLNIITYSSPRQGYPTIVNLILSSSFYQFRTEYLSKNSSLAEYLFAGLARFLQTGVGRGIVFTGWLQDMMNLDEPHFEEISPILPGQTERFPMPLRCNGSDGKVYIIEIGGT